MSTTQFPFAFDAEKMKDMFKMPEMDKMFEGMQMPHFDMDGMMQAQQKNIAALVEANKVAMAGYQEIYKRQVSLVEEILAKAKDQLSELQSQPMSTDQATRNAEVLKSSFDKMLADVKELTEMAQEANTEAFNIVKSRFEEALGEYKNAAEKIAG